MNMNNYKFGKIYRLISPSTDDVYIGSTTKQLCIRLQYHKYSYKRYLNGKCRYVTSFELVKYDDACIELICDYPCNNKKELERADISQFGGSFKLYKKINKKTSLKKTKKTSLKKTKKTSLKKSRKTSLKKSRKNSLKKSKKVKKN